MVTSLVLADSGMGARPIRRAVRASCRQFGTEPGFHRLGSDRDAERVVDSCGLASAGSRA
jgi:hypothetical protein